jgi:choline dehydrogenase-like flavoprotein
LIRSGLQHPHIGRHLNLHPTVSVAARYNDVMNPWWGNMMSALSNQVAQVDGLYGAKLETPPVHTGLMGMALPWISGRQHKEAVLQAKHFGAFIVLTRDRDGGRVTVDKRGNPVLDYTISNYDLNHLLKGIEAASQLHVAAGAEELYFPHNSFKTFKSSRGEAALKAMMAEMPHWGWKANQFPLFTAHQMASCRMGGNRATHPVSPSGETYEVKNLYVADASAFPECSGANPMLSTQTLAYYVAQAIKAAIAVVAV